MKLTHVLPWVTFMALAVCRGGEDLPGPVDGVRRQGREAMPSARVLRPSDNEPYGESVESQLHELFIQIRALRNGAKTGAGALDGGFRLAVDAVENKASHLRERLDELETGAADQWRAMLEEIDDAVDELEEDSDQEVTQISA